MLVQTLPDTLTKLAQMGDATIYEPVGDQPQEVQMLFCAHVARAISQNYPIFGSYISAIHSKLLRISS